MTHNVTVVLVSWFDVHLLCRVSIVLLFGRWCTHVGNLLHSEEKKFGSGAYDIIGVQKMQVSVILLDFVFILWILAVLFQYMYLGIVFLQRLGASFNLIQICGFVQEVVVGQGEENSLFEKCSQGNYCVKRFFFNSCPSLLSAQFQCCARRCI